MRTYVRGACSEPDDPPRRRRCVLRLGRAARDPVCAVARDRRRRGGDGGQLRGPARGVRGAMGGARARRLCPDAIVVAPRFSAYVRASDELFELFRRTAPVVEGLSLEEAFLDVAGLERIAGSPLEIARRLRAEAREEIGLAVTVGIARTKTLAKMASLREAGRPARRRPRARARVPASARGRADCGASARRPPSGCDAPDRDRRPACRARPRPRSCRCSVPRPGATCTPSRRNRDPRRVAPVVGDARSAPSPRSVAGRARRPAGRDPERAGGPGHAADAGGGPDRAHGRSCGFASATSRARAARGRCRSRARQPTPSWRRQGACWPRRCR